MRLPAVFLLVWGEAALGLFRPWDIIYLDWFSILATMYKKFIRVDHRPFNKRASFAITALSTMLFTANLFYGNWPSSAPDQSKLLCRSGTGTSSLSRLQWKSNSSSQQRALQSPVEDLKPVEEYIQNHYEPNKITAHKGRNVILCPSESFQQFLIDYKLQTDGKSREVTPFLNSLYHSTWL